MPRTTTPSYLPTPASGDYHSTFEGRWEGESILLGVRLPFVITFEVGEGLVGTINFPGEGAYELEFSEVGIESGRIRFELETPIGAAVWEGGVHPELIEGEYCQAGVMGSFRMRRVGEQAAETTGKDEEVPYRDEEVKFASGDIMLTGSLSIPEGVGPHPTVVLVSGSGAQDRDANFYGFKAFAIIADHLARRGIAVLRFDDRGSAVRAARCLRRRWWREQRTWLPP